MIVECPGCERRYDVSGRPPGTKARCRCGQLFLLPEPSQTAGALSCPKCGGNVKTGSSHCDFCDSDLLVKACPRCFARIFHGSKHCNECGAGVVVPANANPDGSASALCCPRCFDQPHMEARLIGDTLMDECPSCHGVWLDVPAVERLVKERRQVSVRAVLGMGGPKGGSAPQAQPKGRMYLKCPECDTVMNRTNFAKRSGIILDNCKDHGTWFDADELPRVVEFVRDGGVEAAQAADLRRMKEEARTEKTKARAAAQQAAMTMSARRSSKEETIVAAFGGLLDVIGGILSR